MNIPEGFVLVPADPIKAIDMGWAYLDAARDAEPGRDWAFSHSGYRAMIAAAPSPADSTCRTDGRCEYAIQSGAEGNGHCPDGKCAMPGPGEKSDEKSLDERLEAAGMMSVAELLKGAPLDAFVQHAGVNDLDTFGQWVEMKRAEFVRMQAWYELGEKPKDDLYEWVTAHSAVFSEVHVNLKAALPKPAAHLTIPGALEWDGDNGTHGVVGTHGADGESRVHGESEVAQLRALLAQAVGMVNGASDEWHNKVQAAIKGESHE